MMGSFEKLYADLVMADSSVCVVYMTWVRLGPLRHHYAGVERFFPDGSREILRASGSPSTWIADRSDRGTSLCFPTRSGLFRLDMGTCQRPWRPTGQPAAPGVDWWVETPRGDTVVSWPGDGQRTLEGVGYVDRVRLTRRLKGTRVARLRWGRAHTGDSTFVYSAVDLGPGTDWRRAAFWRTPDATPEEWQHFDLVEESESLLVHADGEAGPVIRLEPLRRLHAGVAWEAAPSPKLGDRLVARLVGGHMTDDRWLSRARTESPSGGSVGWAVHETVSWPPRQP
jgi:hypothetical protein